MLHPAMGTLAVPPAWNRARDGYNAGERIKIIGSTMDLRTRLLRAGVQQAPSVRQSSRSKHPPLETLLAGEWIACAGQRCFVRTQQFSRDHPHGCRALGDLLTLPPQACSLACATNSGWAIDYDRAVFLDIETTGLSQNSGTYAFLVGIGFFEPDRFTVRQYFMPDYGDEEALLELLASDLSGRQGLVSFNGRCFDWPILETRYTLARRDIPALDTPHLDLLAVARRLWARVLSSCALSFLEKTVLEISRTEDDIPGFLIPQLYQDYLQWGDTRPLVRVFYHNSMDILTMVTLAWRAGHILCTGPVDDDPFCDHTAVGLLYERWNRTEDALASYRLALAARHAKPEQKGAAAFHLASLLKRLARYDEAMEVWRGQLGGSEIYPYVELAKQYEHRLRNYELAANVIQEALARSQARGSSLRISPDTVADLEHRLARVQFKAARVHPPTHTRILTTHDQSPKRETNHEC
jgi:uncharacterized protein YprB with RNaseH-like and TPR domain